MSDTNGQQGDEVVRDKNGEVVAHGFHVHHDDEDYWMDVRQAGLRERNAAARVLAPSLVGLTVDAAQDIVDQHPGLSVHFMYPGRGYRAIGVFGQITASVHDDLVVAAE